MKVWVIMGNDFPDAVFDNEEGANKYVEMKKREDEKEEMLMRGSRRKVYWRSWEFDLQSGSIDKPAPKSEWPPSMSD